MWTPLYRTFLLVEFFISLAKPNSDALTCHIHELYSNVSRHQLTKMNGVWRVEFQFAHSKNCTFKATSNAAITLETYGTAPFGNHNIRLLNKTTLHMNSKVETVKAHLTIYKGNSITCLHTSR